MIEFNLPQLLSVIPHKWMTVDELSSVGANWNLKNPYVRTYKDELEAFGHILERDGTFWPLTADIETLGVREGCHRFLALQAIESKKPMLVLLPELKYYDQSGDKEIDIYMKIGDQLLSMWPKPRIENNIYHVTNLMHAIIYFNYHAGYISHYLFEHPPTPHPAMNDQAYFEEWYAKKKNELYRA